MSRPRGTPFSLDQDTDRVAGPLSTDCRVWKWSRYPNGYGRVKFKGKAMTANRVFFEQFRGPIPDNCIPDHLCSNKACCDPWHQEPVTLAENSRREWERHGRHVWEKRQRS